MHSLFLLITKYSEIAHLRGALAQPYNQGRNIQHPDRLLQSQSSRETPGLTMQT